MEDKVVKNVLPDILDIQNARVSFDINYGLCINLEDFIWERNKISPQIQNIKIPKILEIFSNIGELFQTFWF